MSRPKTVAIVQSNYIPWKGYFDLINSVDEFILLDDTQYTRRDWRNRNQIKTPHGKQWLSIPVQVKGRYLQLINETLVSEPGWAAQHWKTIQGCYAKAACFQEFGPVIEELYRSAAAESLSEINRAFLSAICGLLGIATPIRWSTDYPHDNADKNERILSLCAAAGATRYLSGPSARDYLDADAFREAGIELVFFDYSGYPEYRQLHGAFDHFVSILDLLFNEGGAAPRFMKSFPT